MDQEVDTGSKADDVSGWQGFSSTMYNKILQSLAIKSGFVNKVPVKVMRDTGCTTVFVRADLVHDNQWTGKKRTFFMINNSYDFAPVAVVDVDWPRYKGYKC